IEIALRALFREKIDFYKRVYERRLGQFSICPISHQKGQDQPDWTMTFSGRSDGLVQGYSIRNPKGPLDKFPFRSGSGTVMFKIQKLQLQQKSSSYAQKVMWSGLICV